jgi:RIO-like serine/threonine protein kinase
VTSTTKLLKKDLFGEVWLKTDRSGHCILRDCRKAAPPLRPIARLLMRREARALRALQDIRGVPKVLSMDAHTLTRSYLSGTPLHEARMREARFYNAAARLLRRMHTAGVAHNDLAKEPNLLLLDDGSPGIIDFQLAQVASKRTRLFRLAAREDIRHLLKHKRYYCADALTQRERRILARPSLPSRLYMATVKPVYLFVTRRLLGWADREGAGDRGAQR